MLTTTGGVDSGFDVVGSTVATITTDGVTEESPGAATVTTFSSRNVDLVTGIAATSAWSEFLAPSALSVPVLVMPTVEDVHGDVVVSTLSSVTSDSVEEADGFTTVSTSTGLGDDHIFAWFAALDVLDEVGSSVSTITTDSVTTLRDGGSTISTVTSDEDLELGFAAWGSVPTGASRLVFFERDVVAATFSSVATEGITVDRDGLATITTVTSLDDENIFAAKHESSESKEKECVN